MVYSIKFSFYVIIFTLFFYYNEYVYLFHTSQIFITWEAATGCSGKKGLRPEVQNISLCLPGPIILLFFKSKV